MLKLLSFTKQAKQLKKIFNKNKLILTWFFSYFSIMLVVSTGIFISYNQVQILVENKIIKANDLLLEQTKNIIDSKLYDIQKLSLQVSINSNVNKFASLTDNIPVEQRMNINTLREFLLQLKYINGFIDDLYIYYENLSIGVSPNGVAPVNELYSLYHHPDAISYSEWQSLFDDVHRGSLIKTENSVDDSGDILYIQSLPIENVDNYSAALVIIINQQKFKDIVKTVPFDESEIVYIFDHKGVLINSGKAIELSDIEKYLNSEGLLYEEIDGKQNVICSKQSDYTNLTYVSIMPTAVYWREKNIMLNMIVASVFIMFIAGIVLSVYFSKKNYSPIKNIVLSLGKVIELMPEQAGNEYDYIQKAINATIKQKVSAENVLVNYSNVLKDNFFLKLLNGKIDNEQYIYDAFKSFGINFKEESYIIILFYIEDYAALFADDKKTPANERLKLVKFALANVFNEVFPPGHDGTFIDIGENMQIFLLNSAKESVDDINSKILSATLLTGEFLKDNLGISFVTSVGNLNPTVFGIQRSYKEALDAMEYRNIFNEKKVVFCHELNKYEDCYYYPSEMEFKLLNYIKNGDYQQAEMIVDEIFAKNFMDNNLSLEWAKCLKFDILSTIVRVTDTKKDVSFINKLDPVQRISVCEYPSQIESELKKMLKEICEYVCTNKMKDSNYKLCVNIADFVREHYHNLNLSVFMIGEVFNKTPHYLSTLFKNQTGDGLNEYINKIRLEKAKEMLKSKSMTMEKIAAAVGYSDSNALIRNFKKYEGVTPGAYKKSLN